MKRFIQLALLCGAMASTVCGQQTSGSADAGNLTGHVTDSTGYVLSGANVVVRSDGTFVANAQTDRNGNFSFHGAAGPYDVTISHQGFATLTVPQKAFSANEPAVFKLLGGLAVVHHTVREGADRTSSWEQGVLVQGGVGLQDRSDFSFTMVGGHLGKVLTRDYFAGKWFQGNGEYAVEVFPFWQSYTPTFLKIKCPVNVFSSVECSKPFTTGGTYTGASITPIILRWNMTHQKRLMPWVQGAGGVLWTNHKYPAIGDLNAADPTQTGPAANSSVWNFTPQFGVGAHYFVKPRQSVDFSANAIHISSASLGDKNPGVNASVQFSIGYSWWGSRMMLMR
jgi:lipid A 3-O-deacylase